MGESATFINNDMNEFRANKMISSVEEVKSQVSDELDEDSNNINQEFKGVSNIAPFDFPRYHNMASYASPTFLPRINRHQGILIVDDNQFNIEALVLLLRRRYHKYID
jgi:hypothetical protein